MRSLHKSNEKDNTFLCPMKCEGEKVYDQPGECPVCNMHLVPVDGQMKPDHETHQHAHPGKSHSQGIGTYYCPMRCEGDRVYEEPGDCPVCGMHLNKAESQQTSKLVYTCPMHPEVRQNGPGSCPKCGMDLVPEKGEETSEEEMAYRRMSKKFWIALALSLPVFVIAMSDFFAFLRLDQIASKKVWAWIEFILASPVVFYSGRDFFKKGLYSRVRFAMRSQFKHLSQQHKGEDHRSSFKIEMNVALFIPELVRECAW